MQQAVPSPSLCHLQDLKLKLTFVLFAAAAYERIQYLCVAVTLTRLSPCCGVPVVGVEAGVEVVVAVEVVVVVAIGSASQSSAQSERTRTGMERWSFLDC